MVRIYSESSGGPKGLNTLEVTTVPTQHVGLVGETRVEPMVEVLEERVTHAKEHVYYEGARESRPIRPVDTPRVVPIYAVDGEEGDYGDPCATDDDGD